MLGRVLAEYPEAPTREELMEAINKARDMKLKRDLQKLTYRIRTAEGKGDTKQVRLLLILRKAVEADYLMSKYADKETESDELEWKRGLEMLDKAIVDVRKLK